MFRDESRSSVKETIMASLVGVLVLAGCNAPQNKDTKVGIGLIDGKNVPSVLHLDIPAPISPASQENFATETPAPSSTPLPTRTPAPPNEFVKTPLAAAHATAESRGVKTTFEAQSPFTPEIYLEVMKHFALLYVNVKSGGSILSSGWFALNKDYPNRYFLVSSGHGIIQDDSTLKGSVPSILAYQPDVNGKTTVLKPDKVKVDNINDIVLYSGLIPKDNTSEMFKGLPYMTELPRVNEPILGIGVPSTYFDSGNYSNSTISAQIQIPKYVGQEGPYSYFEGNSWSGDSGGPWVVVIDGAPNVIGNTVKTISRELPPEIEQHGPFLVAVNNLTALSGLIAKATK